jgi:hypothetical protein
LLRLQAFQGKMKTYLTLLLIIICAQGFGQTSIKSFGLTLGLPWVNNYTYYDYETKSSQNKSGFIGFEFALFYKQDRNKFSLNAGLTGDSPGPFGVEYSREGTRTSVSSTFIELIYHRQVYKKIIVAFGINNIWYNFDFNSFVDSLPSYRKSDRTIGVLIEVEYAFNKHISLAATYRPVLFSTKYRHILSLDLRFNFNIWKLFKPATNMQATTMRGSL